MADIQKLKLNVDGVNTTYDISVPWSKVSGTTNIMTTNTAQTVTGVKTFKYDSWGVFELLRNANNYDSVIKYSNISDGALGYMGFGGSASPADIAKKPYWSPDGNTLYPLIHSGNIGSQSVNYATSAGSADVMSSYASASSSATKRRVWISWDGVDGKPAYSDNLTFQTSTNTLFVGNTAVSLNGHTHSYLPLTGGTITGDIGIQFGDTDKFIMWDYDGDGNAGASWRIGAKGSGSGNTNYFCIESGTSGISESIWNNVLNIGQNDFIVYFSQTPKVGSTNVSLEGHTHSYAASSHTHDDRYYTESEINTKLAGKSDTHSHPYLSTSGGTISSSGWNAQLHINRTSSSGSWGPAISFDYDGACNGTLTMSSNKLYVGDNGSTRTEVSLVGHTHSYAASSHTHDYLSLSGGTLSGMLTIEKSSASSDAIYWVKTTNSNHYLGFGEGTSGNRGIYDQNLGWVFKIASNDVTTVYANGGFYQSSDERLKTFYEPIKVDLDKLKTLRKNYFKFNDKEDKLEIGVSAQEVQEIYPELVTVDEEGYLSVAYDKLSVIALKAIDELDNKYQKEINDLNDQLSTIKNILKEKGIL